MRMNSRGNKLKNLFLTMMLIVAMALTVDGCGGKAENDSSGQQASEAAQSAGTEEQASEAAQSAGTEEQESEEAQPADTQEQLSEDTQTAEGEPEEGGQGEATVLGEGQTTIQFVVVDAEGNETDFEIHTDKETVGDALLEFDLIAGDESDYGLYVKEVNGIVADYDVDQTYWAFYVDGEYASTGVDSTPIEEGKTYSFKVEK